MPTVATALSSAGRSPPFPACLPLHEQALRVRAWPTQFLCERPRMEPPSEARRRGRFRRRGRARRHNPSGDQPASPDATRSDSLPPSSPSLGRRRRFAVRRSAFPSQRCSVAQALLTATAPSVGAGARAWRESTRVLPCRTRFGSQVAFPVPFLQMKRPFGSVAPHEVCAKKAAYNRHLSTTSSFVKAGWRVAVAP